MERDFSGEHPLNLLVRACRSIAGRARGFILRSVGCLAPGSGWRLFFGASARFHNPRMLSLGADVAFGRNARIECFAAEGDLPGRPKLIIGSGSTFGDGVHIGCLNSIRIGQSVLGGSYILIVDHSHGHPRDDLAARELVPPHKRPIVSKGGITIEDGVWIGDGAVILAGAHIGEGAIIGANAVVRGKVACRTIYLGTPA